MWESSCKASAVFVAFIVWGNVLHAQAMKASVAIDGFQDRCAELLAVYDTVQSQDYYAAAVQYARGKANSITRPNLLSLLARPRGDVFWMVNNIAAWLHAKNTLPPDVAAQFRLCWKTYAPYRGDTENHWISYYAALYLASEQWPDESGSTWFNGRSSRENRAESKDYILHWIRRTVSDGMAEFDSPVYFPVYISAFTLLHDFAQDETVRNAARFMLDYLFADFAVDHFHGQYTGAFSRVNEGSLMNPLSSPASGLAWLYFGEGTPNQTQTEILCALSSYRLPKNIARLATDRANPYVQWERKSIRKTLRLWNKPEVPVWRYSYVTPFYALGSVQGGFPPEIQLHSWGLHLGGKQGGAAVFGIHPYWSEEQLGMFFPEETKTVIADVVAAKSYYTNPLKWTGASPYERIFQYKSTLIALYSIPQDAPCQSVNGFLPSILDTVILDPSGWIFSRHENVYIGWKPLASFDTVSVAGGVCIQSSAPTNGYIVEVRSKSEIGDFQNFIAQLRNRKPILETTEGVPFIEYSALGGETLRFAYDGERSVNGKSALPPEGKLFDGPHLKSRKNSLAVEISYDGDTLVLDPTPFLSADGEN